jgi:hypothetical protein
VAMKRDREVCAVSDGECIAPAGVGISGVGWGDGEGWARGECWRCGNKVCGKCSKRLWWHGARRRWCNDCIEQEWPAKVFQ